MGKLFLDDSLTPCALPFLILSCTSLLEVVDFDVLRRPDFYIHAVVRKIREQFME